MMKVGLLWFDNDSARDLASKVARAAAHYQRKYGRAPQLCYVNPDTLKHDAARGNGSKAVARDNGDVVAGIQVLTSKTVLPNHFWLGVKEEAADSNGAARRSRAH
jgi:hypothetical protein